MKRTPTPPEWKQILTDQLPRLGHRNWIVVADSAYPWQTAPGIETIITGVDQISAVRFVLQSIDAAPHVRPILYLDAELPHLAEADAPGIQRYRAELDSTLSRGAGFRARKTSHTAVAA